VTEFRPLLESSANPRTRELLRAGLAERPSARAVERTAAALGAGVALTTSTASAAVFGGTAASAAGGSSAVGALALAKWLAVGALSGTVVAGGAALVQHSFDESESAAHATPAAAREAAGDARRVSGAGTAPERKTDQPFGAASGTAPGEDDELVPQRSPNPLPPSTVPSSAGSGALVADGPLTLELAHIDRARAALARGEAERALGELSAYRAIRTTGTLDREAWILRIDALLLLGKRDEARELARSYLERFPRDAHATRLGELSGDGTKK
jgi:hypothetical protein